MYEENSLQVVCFAGKQTRSTTTREVLLMTCTQDTVESRPLSVEINIMESLFQLSLLLAGRLRVKISKHGTPRRQRRFESCEI